MAGHRKGYVSLTCYLPVAISKKLDELSKQEAARSSRRPDRCRTAALIQAILLSHQKATDC